MSATPGSPERTTSRTTRPYPALGLAALVLLGPLAWLMHLSVSYWLVPVACGHRSHIALYLTTIPALAGAGAAVWFGYRLAVREGRKIELIDEHGTRAEGGTEEGGTEEGHGLLLALGLFLGGFFLLIVAVAGIAPLLLNACS